MLRLIVKGQRMKEIAAALGLSTRTVETHKYEMMQVLGVHSTAELVRYAIEHRLIGGLSRLRGYVAACVSNFTELGLE